MIAPALRGRFTGPAGEQLHGWWSVPVTRSGSVVPDGATAAVYRRARAIARSPTRCIGRAKR